MAKGFPSEFDDSADSGEFKDGFDVGLIGFGSVGIGTCPPEQVVLGENDECRPSRFRGDLSE